MLFIGTTIPGHQHACVFLNHNLQQPELFATALWNFGRCAKYSLRDCFIPTNLVYREGRASGHDDLVSARPAKPCLW